MARESSQITPPSGLRVNRKSAVAVHVQLQTQIRHLIDTGGLKPGKQVPTVRQLAGFLRINRNTVARALAVTRHLSESDGVQATRLTAAGYGEFRPLVPNDNREDRAKNRRVEIWLVPKGLALPPAAGNAADLSDADLKKVGCPK